MAERIVAVYDLAHQHHRPRDVDGCENADRVENIMETSFAADTVRILKSSVAVPPEIGIIHSRGMLQALRDASLILGEQARRTKYCSDEDGLNTPIRQGTYQHALAAAACAREAAQLLKVGYDVSYSISRPPGHHAGYDFYEGFCYLNNDMVAAYALAGQNGARVAVLDFDHHYGHGSADIVNRVGGRVFYVSTHADPHDCYPGTGYADDIGFGRGRNHIVNFPYEPGVGERAYLELFSRTLRTVSEMRPNALVVAAGFDTHRDDHPPGISSPTQISSSAFEDMAVLMRRALPIPTAIILGGGYGSHLAGSFDAFFTTVNRYV